MSLSQVAAKPFSAISRLFRHASIEHEFRTLLNSVTAGFDMPLLPFLVHLDNARRHFLHQAGRTLEKRPDAALLILKVLNLLLTKYEYQHQRINKLARPVGFMLDPAHGCQLGCPTCVNSSNQTYVNAVFNRPPKGMMKADTFTKFIDDVGLFAFSGHFYNKHEPLLNKNTPAYVRRAVTYRIETFISSNLSFPKLDAEAIVTSGLKELMVAIDGVSQDVYSKYRRGGHVDLAFENVRKIAETKQRLGLTTPYLRWQYLTFAHNVGEVERAIDVASSLGFDSFNLATPMDVSADEPSVDAVAYDGPEEHRQVVFNTYPANTWPDDLAQIAPQIMEHLSEAFVERYKEVVDNAEDEDVTRGDDYCDWLHLAVAGDAFGRIVPCCLGDYKGTGRFIFSDIDTDKGRLMNSTTYRDARLLITDPSAYTDRARPAVRCQGCSGRPLPQVGLGAVHNYLMGTGSGSLRSWFDEELAVELCGWSQHKSVGISASSLAGGAIVQYAGEEGCQRMPATHGTQVVSATMYAYGEAWTGKIPCRGAVEFVVRVAYGKDTASPIVGVTLFDAEGLQVTAMNSTWAGQACASANTGDTRQYRFRMTQVLPRGNYSLEFAVASSPSEVIHRLPVQVSAIPSA